MKSTHQPFRLSSTLAASALALCMGAQPVSAEEMGEVIVTASRSGEGIDEDKLGASVTVITPQDIEQRQVRVVSDVLRDVPGIAVNRAGPVGGQTQIRLRGTEGNHVLVLVDGIEAADPFQGEYDLATLLADPGTRIEVLRGQQSALYGSDAIGGVVQTITASAAEMPGTVLRAEGGSFGSINGAARYARVQGDLDYVLSGNVLHSDGTASARDGSRDLGADIASASGKFIWTPTGNIKVTAVGRYSYTKADYNESEFDPSNAQFGLIVDSPGVYYRNEGLYGLINAEIGGLDGRWLNTVGVQVSDIEREGFASYGQTSGDEGQRVKGSFTSSIRFGDEALSHELTAAVDLEREKYRNTTPSEFAFQGKRDADNLGLVAQYQLQAGDAVTLGASLRQDVNNRFADATTWRVQGSYAIVPGTRLRAAWATGVKNPLFYELYGYSDGRYIGNPDLKPEKSRGWEVGLDQSFAGDMARIGLTWFDSTLRNEITTEYPAPDFLATPVNLDSRSKQQGLEASAELRPVAGLRLLGSYTYLKARENGAAEVRRPKHIASFNASWTSPDDSFDGTLSVRYNGRQDDLAYTDPSYVPVREALDSYVLVNMAAEYRLGDGIALTGRIENLFDEEYEEIFSYVGSGRAAYAGVRITL